jgi:hypothetical protein
MAALQDRRARLLASLYAAYGEAASWSADSGAATSVTIRRQAGDAEIGFGGSEALVDSDVFRVRTSEIATPATGDKVTLTEGGQVLKIIADPRRAKQGAEWVCQGAPVRF